MRAARRGCGRLLPLALLVVLVLIAPTALGAPASVRLEETSGAWNGESRVDLEPAAGPREVLVWVPENARIQSVLARTGESAFATGWAAAGPDALRVGAPPDASAVVVRFDITEQRPYLVRFVAPQGIDSLRMQVLPEGGRVAESDDITFAEGVASAPVAPGESIAVRVVDPGRVGELPLLVTLAGLSALAVLLAVLWHRVRPPNDGREPQKLMEHLGELQARLLPPVIVFALCNVFYFASGLRAVDGMIVPTWGADASISARAFEAVAERLVPPGVQLVVLRPADAVLAQVGMCLFLAFVTVLPLLVYELGAFIAPGLEPRERRIAARVLPLVSGLFLVGALLAYLVMAPLMVRTLYSYAPGIGAAPLLAVGDLVSFALLVILAMGIAFELPVLMYVLGRLGLVRASTFGRYVRHAVVAIVIAAGIITPDPSVVSQLLLAVPIILLYVVGIGAAAAGERGKRRPA